MKTILTRTMIVAILGASVSAFAQSSDPKPVNTATSANVTQQDSCSQNMKDAAKQDKQKSSEEQKIEQQGTDWLHNLQGIYGG